MDQNEEKADVFQTRYQAAEGAKIPGLSDRPVNTDEAEANEKKRQREMREARIQKREREERMLKRRRRTVIIVMAELVVCLILGIGCYGLTLLNSYNYEELDPTIYRETTTVPTSPKETASKETATSLVEVTDESGEVISVQEVTVPVEPSLTGYRNILILGLDEGTTGNRYGYDDQGRNSDVMIIMSINNDTGEIRMASIMRDLILKLEKSRYYPYDKANAQYAQTGLSDTVSMINRNFGLDIGEYITINWYSVATLIDQMGGVELTIPNEEILRYFNGYLTAVNNSTGIWSPQLPSPGTYTMTGTQAVAFCRIRYGGYNDDGRTNNQREVITKLFEKAKLLAKSGDVGTLLTVTQTALSNVKTNLKFPDIIRMLNELDTYKMGGNMKVPQSYETSSYLGNYYVKYHVVDPVVATDFEQEVKNLHQFLYDDVNYVPSDFIKSISQQMYNDRKGIN